MIIETVPGWQSYKFHYTAGAMACRFVPGQIIDCDDNFIPYRPAPAVQPNYIETPLKDVLWWAAPAAYGLITLWAGIIFYLLKNL